MWGMCVCVCVCVCEWGVWVNVVYVCVSARVFLCVIACLRACVYVRFGARFGVSHMYIHACLVLGVDTIVKTKKSYLLKLSHTCTWCFTFFYMFQVSNSLPQKENPAPTKFRNTTDDSRRFGKVRKARRAIRQGTGAGIVMYQTLISRYLTSWYLIS